ncbi:thiamine pyrophosphate-binding protein [Thermocatellispora tengchongensis]|uniref:thiamine pyrophosphate-binding protein n=1 Tax=Thermocatellispora tengchongensis TaxID=1073253 RepID=UPI00248335E9
MSSSEISVHVAIARALADQGMTTLFGVVGEGNIHVIAHLVEDHRVRYVKAAREDGAVLMATGYASVTGEVGFATVTHGPGLTNTMTALTQAARSGLPVVVLAGDTDPALPYGRQRIDQAALVAPTGAGFQPIASPATAVDDVARAVGRARAERRPIVLNAPVDLQHGTVAYSPSRVNLPAPQAVAPDADALDRAAGVIAAARRPVILAGRGAALAGAKKSILALAEHIGAPVSTTLRAKDLFRGEPFDLGICGTLSHGPASETILAADCLVVFGAGLNPDTTADGSLVAGKRIVHIDLDPARLGLRTEVTVAVQADAERAAVTLLDRLGELDLRHAGTLCTEELRTRLAEFDPRSEFAPYAGGPIDSRELTLLLDQVFPHDRTYVSDSGRFMLPGFAWLHVPEPSAFIETVDFGSIGLGLATAIGAAVGRPDRPVLLTAGDGGLAMELPELLTAVRYGLDLVLVVYNDSAYGAEVAITDLLGKAHDISRLPGTDFAAIARSMGASGLTVARADDLPLIAEAIEHRRGPVVIDVKTDPRTPIPH